MIDHISIAVSDLARSAEFYETALATIGLKRLVERPRTVGFGKKYPEFWLNAWPGMAAGVDGTGAHICLRAPSQDAVAAFYAAALVGGARSDGEPGPRQGEMMVYFGAFILDFDGNKIEVLTFPRD
jgi:catechol 2,3-dioxygenase-like lactoylglutathione lyase family enzyme